MTAGSVREKRAGLEWDDIDLKAGTVSVRRTIVQVGEEFIINPPKTAKGKRLVTICSATVEALKAHKVKMWKEGRPDGRRVFVSRTGNYIRRNALRKSFLAILENAGLPAVRFHDLRHTCASLLLEQNTHAKVIQERLGHSQIGITLDTYSHVMPTMQREAAETMGGILKRTGS